MTIEDILKTPVYLRANAGFWTPSSYESLHELMEGNKDKWFLLEPSEETTLSILQGYLLVRGIEVKFVKKIKRSMFNDYVYKIGDL